MSGQSDQSENKSDPLDRVNLSRKDFLRFSASAASAAGLYLLRTKNTNAFPYEPYPEDDDLVSVVTSCAHNCGARHILVAHKKGDTIVRLSTDDGSIVGGMYGSDLPEAPQLRACLRGRSYRSRVYSSKRLLYPMIRTGKRGEGRFRRASWDEALDLIAEKLVELKENYGPTAILDQSYAGATFGVLHKSDQIRGLLGRFLGMFGCRTSSWSVPSYQGTSFSSKMTFGTTKDGSDEATFQHSKLIIMWGWNPAYTFHGSNLAYYLRRAKQNGCRFVLVDPQYTDSAAAYDAWWIPIRPATDAAMLAAMAYVIFSENLQDQDFIDRFAQGVDPENMPEEFAQHESFREYILGIRDGIPKTPRWASSICDVSSEDIVRLARMYATEKPAALKASWAPGRNEYGEQYSRMAAALQTITGNIGIMGGSAEGVGKSWSPRSIAYPFDKYSNRWWASIKSDRWAHTVLNYPQVKREEIGLWPASGKFNGIIPNIRAIWWHGSNWLNQLPNINKELRAIEKLDFIVCQDATITPSGLFADVLLPAATHFERHDVGLPWYKGEFYIHRPKVIEPRGESKTDFQIFTELAYRLEGHATVKDFGKKYNPLADRSYFYDNDLTDEAYLRRWWEDQVMKIQKVGITWDEFKKRGAYRFSETKPHVAFENEIETGKPFKTKSGKIEIFSLTLANYEKGNSWANTPYGYPIPSIPRWIEPDEYHRSLKSMKFPFQLVTPHPRWRTHSIYYDVDWLKEIYDHSIIINLSDASGCKITSGDVVEVFNERGRIILIARITERIRPGVAAVHEGVWMNLGATGADHAGNPDMLTRDEPSPAGAFAYNTLLVGIRRSSERHLPDWKQTSLPGSAILYKQKGD